MKTNSVSPLGTAAFVIGSIITTYFFAGPRRGKRTVLFDEQQRELDRNLTTPVNGTFALVWPVIYSGTTGLMVHQALPSERNNPRYAQARPWWIASYALNLLFGYFFSRPDKASRIGYNATTLALLPTAIGLHRSLAIDWQTVPQPERTLRRSVSLYAGWLTAATVVSTTNLLLEAGYQVSPGQAARWANGLIPFTAMLGMGISRRLNDPYYLIPLVCAFAGVVVKQRDRATDVAAVAGACTLVTTVVLLQRIRTHHAELLSDEPKALLTEENEPAENALVYQ